MQDKIGKRGFCCLTHKTSRTDFLHKRDRGRKMRAPVIREMDKKECGFEEPVVKIMEEQHFCPICNKPTAKYHQEFYDNGEQDNRDIDFDEGWLWIDPEESVIEITLDVFEDDPDKENSRIDFTPKEFGLEVSNPIKKIFNEFYEEYKQKYNLKNSNTPIFCSKTCAKKFILSKLKQQVKN